MGFIYFFIALSATTIGAISGFGGGVIIKPVLDAFGNNDIFVIGVLSSSTVLCMAVVSTIRHCVKGFALSKRIVFIAAGALLGGIAGKELFGLLYRSIQPDFVKLIQAGALIILLILVLFQKKLPRYNINNPVVIIFTGVLLGSVSSFLGIGGGPFNIVILCMLFNMQIKQAAVASIFIILFSQVSNLTALAISPVFWQYDYSMLYYMIPAGIAGGFVGCEIGRKLSNKTIERIYFAIVLGLLCLNAYNIGMVLI